MNEIIIWWMRRHTHYDSETINCFRMFLRRLDQSPWDKLMKNEFTWKLTGDPCAQSREYMRMFVDKIEYSWIEQWIYAAQSSVTSLHTVYLYRISFTWVTRTSLPEVVSSLFSGHHYLHSLSHLSLCIHSDSMKNELTNYVESVKWHRSRDAVSITSENHCSYFIGNDFFFYLMWWESIQSSMTQFKNRWQTPWWIYSLFQLE